MMTMKENQMFSSNVYLFSFQLLLVFAEATLRELVVRKEDILCVLQLFC